MEFPHQKHVLVIFSGISYSKCYIQFDSTDTMYLLMP